MNPLNQVNIEELSTTYNIRMSYHSDKKCENYDAEVTGIEESDGGITIKPGSNPLAVGFVFNHSDPDRVIAIAQMIQSFAQMVKKNNQKSIDASANE